MCRQIHLDGNYIRNLVGHRPIHSRRCKETGIKLDNNLILEHNFLLLHFDLLLLHLDLHPTTSTAAGSVSDSVFDLLLCGESTIHCHQVVTLAPLRLIFLNVFNSVARQAPLCFPPCPHLLANRRRTKPGVSQTSTEPIPKPRFLYLQDWSFSFQLFTI
ncbi:unnamed protein product [Brassica oleracea var. botrytis]|uniref:(rape) hypothetical protein n=1 Tax=Brassica napus TaxID=3708 RepID=A0A816KRM8_BRANA|nr:unnamed protein product [Brassica napus]